MLMQTMQIEDLLEVVQAIEACTGRMLQAARENDAAALAQARLRCDRLIEILRAAGPSDHWPKELRHARLRLMGRILQNEAALRRINCPDAAQGDALVTGAT